MNYIEEVKNIFPADNNPYYGRNTRSCTYRIIATEEYFELLRSLV